MSEQKIVTIVCEAAEAFASSTKVGATDAARLSRLVTAQFDRLADVDQLRVAGILARAPELPDAILDHLVGVPAMVIAPFAALSPALGDERLLELVERHGAGPVSRAIARRTPISRTVSDALRTLCDPATDRALELRQRPLPGIRQTAIPALMFAALDTGTEQRLIGYLTEGDYGLFETALADRLGLAIASARAICDDPMSRNFLYAMRLAGFSLKGASDVFEALHPSSRFDERIATEFARAYRLVDDAAAAQKVERWRLEDAASRARTADNTDARIVPTGSRAVIR